ncbi:PAS domain-containing sensor histidine kinase [Mucilaginibacter segetis]|uniref:histidine kinase n=1 Tax=Mucilaginibacter segetis TaxID=2793071 RepID=A0A934PTI2_9SPHI|nr:PAS domain S-box protein [Mucilaginibacter segetis]MBK0379140.1 PAS domain S-box protein [Mucilaginibacter segetis]
MSVSDHENRSVDEKLFRLLVASLKDCSIFLIDPNGFILSWNEGAENIKGYKSHEVIGKHISIFYRSDDVQKQLLRHNLNQALKNGLYECEGWRVRKNGSAFWANVVFTTLYNDNGHLIGFAKVTRDITERKKIEEKKAAINAELERRVKVNTEKIIANELRFRKLIENSYDGITLFDGTLKVFYRSMSCERIIGWGDKDTTGNAVDIVHPEDVERVKLFFDYLLTKPGHAYKITNRVRHKKGYYLWIESAFTNMLHDVNISAIVCNFKDVTKARNAEEEREKMTADLVQRNKDLEQFTYIVSHNLRAPVANIIGLSNLLRSANSNDIENKEILNALSASVHNMDKVIIDLNNILQVNSEVNDKIEIVSLPILLEEIQMSINNIITKNNVNINYDFGTISSLLSLKSYLYSIFQNLIVNSIKYRQTDIQPVINISSKLSETNIYIYISDNGKGIDLVKHGVHLFGLYKRFDWSVEGKGMGLFMVKMQVERLGGNITVKSELNKGTTFTLTFPLTLLPPPGIEN